MAPASRRHSSTMRAMPSGVAPMVNSPAGTSTISGPCRSTTGCVPVGENRASANSQRMQLGYHAAVLAPVLALTMWKGVALGLYSEDPGFSYAPLLGEIARLGATHVEFVINLYQRDGASTEIHAHTRFTPSDGAILTA